MLLHYKSLAAFRSIFYKDLLTQEHLQEGQVLINKVVLPDGGEDETFNFWGYKLIKDGVKYLLSAKASGNKELVLKDTLPIMVQRSEKVAYRNEVFHVIRKYSSARFKAEKSLTFKELVDRLSSFKHTNPDHQKLLYFTVLAQLYHRANFRVCSPPSFGKDSAVDTLGYLVGGAATIVQPTRAKLEYRASLYNLLALNEASDIGNTEWENIQSFLLDAGAFKSSIEKQTRAFGVVGESIDISEFSLLIMYNDIIHVSEKNREKYIDVRAHKALLDRFPPLRLHGKLTEDFSAIATKDVDKEVEKNLDFYKEIIRNYMYYKQQPPKPRYNRDKLINKYGVREVPERWKMSLGALLNVIDLYCSSQEEFDRWVGIINASIQDYYDMMALHLSEERNKKKWGEVKYRQLLDTAIVSHPTFTERRKALDHPETTSTNAFDWDKVTV